MTIAGLYYVMNPVYAVITFEENGMESHKIAQFLVALGVELGYLFDFFSCFLRYACKKKNTNTVY